MPPSSSSMISPSRIRKLISNQRDPLLSKDLYELAHSLRPDLFSPSSPSSYSPLHSLILRLARSRRHSSAALSLLRRIPSPSPGLFSSLFSSLKPHSPLLLLSAYRILLNSPSTITSLRPRHVNCLLSALVADSSTIPTALSAMSNPSLPTDAHSYTILIREFAVSGRLALAFSIFKRMIDRADFEPEPEAYRAIIQGLCRRSQVTTATEILEDMMHKGRDLDSLACTTLLNSLCRKKRLREAYKLLCRMCTCGCSPDIVHYNTVIAGFCHESRAMDACKVFDDMSDGGCSPNLVSYSILVNGLCLCGFFEQGRGYLEEMERRGLVPHFSLFHAMVKGFYNVGKFNEASRIFEQMLRQQVAPHSETWMLIVSALCGGDSEERLDGAFRKIANKEDKQRRKNSVKAENGLEGHLMTSLSYRRNW